MKEGMMMLLPVQFRPFNDEMPLSWMQRMALANGFDDLREMMHIIGIISKPYDYPSSDHWKDVAKMFYDQEWIKSYQDEVKKASLLIDNMMTKKIYICPQCLNEELQQYGQFYYHMQHHYIGAHTCWKHHCNLASIDPIDYLIFEKDPHLQPDRGMYDPNKEQQILSLVDDPEMLFEELIRYQIWILMKQTDKNLDDINQPSDIPLNAEYMDRFDDVPELLFDVVKGKHAHIKDEATKTYIFKCLFDDYHSYIHLIDRLKNRKRPAHIDLMDILAMKGSVLYAHQDKRL